MLSLTVGSIASSVRVEKPRANPAGRRAVRASVRSLRVSGTVNWSCNASMAISKRPATGADRASILTGVSVGPGFADRVVRDAADVGVPAGDAGSESAASREQAVTHTMSMGSH